MLPTDYVKIGCVDNNKECELHNKCKICIKEIKDLIEINKMFFNIFKDINLSGQVR